MSKIAAQVH